MNLERLKTLAVSETGFVFDPRTGHSYSVNASGLAAIAALRAGLSVEAAAARIRQEFDASDEPVEDHVESLVALLAEMGLVERRDSREVPS